MGQQQLLLIVLGVILVGVAVVLGIQYFGVGAEEGAKDELVAHAITVGANAQQWYKKPLAMGGGGGTFDGFTTHFQNNLVNLQTSTNGEYSVDDAAGTTCTVQGDPTEVSYNWHVECLVTSTGMTTTIVSN